MRRIFSGAPGEGGRVDRPASELQKNIWKNKCIALTPNKAAPWKCPFRRSLRKTAPEESFLMMVGAAKFCIVFEKKMQFLFKFHIYISCMQVKY